jgi:hypothetical protein
MAEPKDKNPVGKPLRFKTVKELEDAIDEYFAFQDARIKEIHTKEGEAVAITHPAPYTMSGLSRALGISRQALSEYTHREEYGDTIKEARDRVQEDIERRLMETPNQSGAIFNLKNNFGWKDKTEVEQKTDVTSNGESINTPTSDIVERFLQTVKEDIDEQAKSNS